MAPRNEAAKGAGSKPTKDDSTCGASSDAPHSSSSLIQLPEEVFRDIVVLLKPARPKDCKDSPAYALYQTCRAARASMWPWIGKTSITLTVDDDHARDALDQLRGFPRMATLRELRLHLLSVNAADLADFLAAKVSAKLAAVQHLYVDTQKPLEMPSALNIIFACPSLLTLEYAANGEDGGFTMMASLQRLDRLQKLHLRSSPSVLDPADAKALGSLVSLQSLQLPVCNLMSVLPQLSSLTDLTELDLVSDGAALRAHYADCTFSSLAALPALRKLGWGASSSETFIMSSRTLSAICSCSNLVNLHIPCHVVVSASNVKLLVEMPRLEVLAVASFQPEVPVRVNRCCLKTLVLTRWNDDWRRLGRLPSEVLHLQDLKLCYVGVVPCLPLGAGDSDAAISAVANDVHAAAPILAVARVHLLGSREERACHLLRLCLAWNGRIPALPTACVIAGLSCLNLARLDLDRWAFDKALAMQVAEAAPGLHSLTLHRCSISSCGWVGLQALTQLSSLFLHDLQEVRSPFMRDALMLYAVGWSRSADLAGSGLSVGISRATLDAVAVEECNQSIQEQRQARGMAGTVTLRNFTWYGLY